MTDYIGVRDPGRSGGSWLMHLCNVHPAVMRIVGEPHLDLELGIPWPGITSERYDEYVIEFMESQAVACTGIVKCFRPLAAKWIIEHGGRIIALVRNPMEVLASNMGKKAGSARQYLGREPRDANDQFRAHALYYKGAYEQIWANRRAEPITRIEDYNRSCSSNGQWLKAVMEWATQTPWPDGYIAHIQKHYLPGYHYGLDTLTPEKALIAIGIRGSFCEMREHVNHALFVVEKHQKIWRQMEKLYTQGVSLDLVDEAPRFKALLAFCQTMDWSFYWQHVLAGKGMLALDMRSDPVPYEQWRMNWEDDPRASEYWAAWSPLEREVFAEVLGPACDNLGYNYQDRPGHVDVVWSLKDAYPWRDGIETVPYTGGNEIRRGFPYGEPGLPRWGPE